LDVEVVTGAVPADVDPLPRQVVFAAKTIRETFSAALERAGGSLGTWIVLGALSDQGPISQKVLGSRAHVDGATVTHHVDRAEARGLVRRSVDPDDRRVRRLELTPEGEALHETLYKVARDFEQAALAGIDAADRERLRSTLAAIVANVESAARA
jgi:DNA-binding MarR family transcriptional regulator